MLSRKYFCLDSFATDKTIMAVKVTRTGVEKLLMEGISTSEIAEMIPTAVLTSAQIRNDKVDQVCQVIEADLADSSLKISILNCLQDIGYTEAEAKTVVLGLEAESLLTDKAACALQVIRSVSFDWRQCPIIVLQAHL